MRKVSLIAFVTLLAAGSARADKEFTYDKQNNFDGGAVRSIMIDMDLGAVKLEKSGGTGIDVSYKNSVIARNQSEADDINQDYKYSAKIEGSRLVVTVEVPHRKRNHKGVIERIFEGDWDQSESHPMLRLSIPDGKSVEIRSLSTDVDVADLTLDLDVGSTSSDVTLDNTQGKFDCDLASGDITMTGHKGPISVEGLSSDIRITDSDGSIDASTASGDVIIEKAKGTVKASSTSGDVRLADIEGDADASSASGNVSVEGCSGSVRAESISGDVEMSALSAAEGDFEATSTSGNVRVGVSRDFKGMVTLESMTGTVDSNLPSEAVERDNDDRHGSWHRPSSLHATVGQGNGRLWANSTSGDITVDGY